jgi:hypothetical protein
MGLFKSLLDGKPATVDIAEDGRVNVTSKGFTWSLTSDLTPESLLLAKDGGEIRFRFAGNQIFSSSVVAGGKIHERSITTEDLQLATFGQALDAIQNVPKHTPLPERVTRSLTAARERLAIRDGMKF